MEEQTMFDPLYLIMTAPVLLLSLWASWRVKSNFEKYSRVRSYSGITGAEAARRILQANGLGHVAVEETQGWLSDHYSPNERVLRLSADVYNSDSVAAIGVAAHEAGHAIQHGTRYSIMGLWQALAKPAAIGSNIGIWLIVIGMFMSGAATKINGMAIAGVILFGVAVLFQIVTLPLEFNASSRAKKLIYEYGILGREEAYGVEKVLGAAAMTYVAAALSSITTLLYFLIRMGLLSSDD